MTDPADIVERLLAWAPLIAQGYEVPAASTAMHEAASLIEAQQAEIDRLRRIAQARKEHGREHLMELREALEWYGENARLCRLIHSEGNAGRHALSEDGGKRARAALKETKDANTPDHYSRGCP